MEVTLDLPTTRSGVEGNMACPLTTLFRPVGLHELSLIWDSGMREFPRRLSHQPIL